MALISLAQARAHVRVASDYPDTQLTPYINGAVDAAEAYLNRAIYETAQALALARQAYPGQVRTASETRDDALAAARLIEGREERCAAVAIAEADYQDAMGVAGRALYGIVVNASIVSAILLTVGHHFANRAAVVTGTTSAELHLGSKELLRPYRRVMMP